MVDEMDPCLSQEYSWENDRSGMGFELRSLILLSAFLIIVTGITFLWLFHVKNKKNEKRNENNSNKVYNIFILLSETSLVLGWLSPSIQMIW